MRRFLRSASLFAALAALGPFAAAAAPAGFSPAELKTLKGADGQILTLSCYFGASAKGCPPASAEAPQWLREDLPAMLARDCQQGATTEARAWAGALGDIGYFLYQARAAGARPAKGKAKAESPAAALAGLKQVRGRFAGRVEMMQGYGFERSLRGRGGDFLGRFRFVLDKMDEAITAREAGNPRRFREASLAVAWQVDELNGLFRSEPSNPYAESGPPDCVGLEAYEGKTVPPSADELKRLTAMAANYRAGADWSKSARAHELALPMAEALGDLEAQEALHAGLSECWVRQGNVEQALPHMGKALDLARARNDLVSERDLLRDFAAALPRGGREEDLRANYENEAEKVQRRIDTALDGYQRGERFFAQGRYLEAKREYLGTGRLGHALSYVKIGVCETRLGNPEAAVAANLEALKLARLQGKKAPEAMALRALAAIYSEQGNATAAMDALEGLLALSLSSDLQKLPAELRWQLEQDRAQDLAGLENLYNLSDRWDRAERVFARLRASARARGLRDESLRAHVYAARAAVAGGNPEKAVDAFVEALREATSGQGLRVETLEFLHRSLFAVQPYWTADIRAFASGFNRTLADLRRRRMQALEEQLAAARERKDRVGLMQAHFAVASEREAEAGAELGRALEEGSHEAAAAEQAVAAYGRALELAERLRRQDYQIASWRGIARMHAARQEWERAAEPLERALTAALWKDGRPLSEADPALKGLDSAIELKLGDPALLGDILRELGYAYLGQGTPITGIEFIRRSLAVQVNELTRIRTLAEFAKLLEVSGYRNQSADFLGRLLSEGKVEGAPRLKATVLISLASVQRKSGGLGQDFALERLEQAYQLLAPRGLNTKDIPLLLALGELRLAKGRTTAAAEAYEAAIAISEQFRAALAGESARLAFLEKDPTHVMNYRIAIGGLFAAAEKDPAFLPRAFAAAEKARARVLLESLRGAELEREGPMRKQETALTQRLAMMAQKGLESGWGAEDAIAFASLQERLARLGDEIRAQDPQYAALRYGAPSGLEAAAAALKPGEAFVSYKFAGRDDALWAFMLQPGRPARLFRLDAGAALEAVRNLPPLEPRRPTEVWEAVPERLGRILWAPLEAELSGAKKVFLVPDAELWTVPWPALESGGQQLVDKPYTLQIVPSGSVLVQLRGERRAKSEAELVAFAPYAGDGKPAARRGRPSAASEPIPGAQEVMDNLRWMFPGAKTFLPPEATKEKALAESGNYRYVVYYTHGLADESNPWLSAIFFTDAAGAQSALTVTEAMRSLRLDRTDLVVLAACESARGQLARGEGVMGLTRGLFYAGARGVVATGWSVAEASSRDIVIGMFQGIHLGLDPARALQMAQRDVRKRKYSNLPGEHPFFWAGFQLYGDPE